MADSIVLLDLMSGGSSVAVDNIGGTSHQYTKMEFGASGVATPVSASNPFPISAINGTVNYVATVESINALTTLSNVTNGSIKVTAGTVSVVTPGTITSGTISVNTPGTITSGTISVNTPGTITSGTISVNTPGTITSGTVAINVGTVGGKAASGAASVANPVQIAGTDSGGSIYSPLITTAGAGTTSGVGTIPGVGVLTTVTNLANGTIQNSGTTTGVGVVTTVTNVSNGTIQNSGTVTGVGVVSALTTGTLANSGTTTGVGVVSMLTGGTINSGTINAGTIRNDGRPARNILSFGTTIIFSASAFATIIGSAAVGVGTSLWVNDLSIVNNGGTVTAGMMFGSAINGSAILAKGNFVGGGGIEKPFPLPVNAGMTNFGLNAWASGAGTVDFTVSYFIAV